MGPQAGQLLDMKKRQIFQGPAAGRREHDPNYPSIIRIPVPTYQSSLVGAVDQTHGAVVAEEEVVGDLSYGRTSLIGMAPDSQ